MFFMSFWVSLSGSSVLKRKPLSFIIMSTSMSNISAICAANALESASFTLLPKSEWNTM